MVTLLSRSTSLSVVALALAFLCFMVPGVRAFPTSNCFGAATSHKDKPIMTFIALKEIKDSHPRYDAQLRPWLSNLANGNPHPDIDAMYRQGTYIGKMPPNHPNIDTICKIKMPATEYSGAHPDIEQGLIAKTNIPVSHIPVHDSLKHAMTTNHRNIDTLLASPNSWTYPANHPAISAWVYRRPLPSPTPPSEQCTSSFDPALLGNHASKADCYIVFGRQVFDLSAYADKHPGGASQVEPVCGKNGTEAFNSAPHSVIPFANVGGHGICKGTIADGTTVATGTGSSSGAGSGGTPTTGAIGGKAFSDGPFSVSWTLEADTQSILFTMSATTKGWVSLGISKQKSMTAMDCYTGSISGGAGVLVDAYSLNSVDAPLHDDDAALKGGNNAQLVESSDVDGKLSFTFRRLLVTGDVAAKDQDIGDFPLYLIWAISDGTYNTIHSKYGISPPINLLTGKSVSALSAGLWLSILVLAFFLLLSVVKYSYKCHKQRQSSKSKQAKADSTRKAAMNPNKLSSSELDVSTRTGPVSTRTGPVLADVASFRSEPRHFSVLLAGAVGGAAPRSHYLSARPNTQEHLDQPPAKDTMEIASQRVEEPPYKATVTSILSSSSSGERIRAPSGYIDQAAVETSVLKEEVPAAAPTSTSPAAPPPTPARPRALMSNTNGSKLNREEKEKEKTGEGATNVTSIDVTVKTTRPLPPKLPPRQKADTAAAAGGFGRNLLAHQAMQLHERHVGQDLYQYLPEHAKSDPLPMTMSYVQDDENTTDLDVYFGDDDLKEKHVSVWYSLKNVLINTRIPHTQWSLGNVLFVVLYLFLNGLALYLTPLRPIDYANGFGSLAAANTMMLIVPATRNSILTWVLGLPFDHVVLYHRLVGRIALLCVLIHAWLYRQPLFANFLLPKYLFGVFAMLCGALIFVTSLEWCRRNKFEIFYWAHFSFIGYFILAWMHVPQCKPFLAVGVILYALDKCLRAIWTLIPRRTLVFTSKGEMIAHVRFAKNPLTEMLGKHKVGQIVQLAKQMRAEPNQRRPWIRIDGPYGKLDFNIRRYNVLFLAGGGVGVTPVMGIMKELFNGGQLSDTDRAAVKPHRIKEVYVMWVIPTVEDYAVFRADIEECMVMARRPQFPTLRVMVYATRAKPEQAVPPIQTGRPNFNIIFDELEREHVRQAGLVFACGPEPMVNELWDQSSRRSLGGSRLDFHHETFNF